MLVVYFSSATENTKRFVEKLGLPSQRIPLRRSDPELTVDEPYVLICPTYGGGASVSGGNSRPVPGQVIRFLNNEGNRSLNPGCHRRRQFQLRGRLLPCREGYRRQV